MEGKRCWIVLSMVLVLAHSCYKSGSLSSSSSLVVVVNENTDVRPTKVEDLVNCITHWCFMAQVLKLEEKCTVDFNNLPR